ncbi:MAG: hypothetical protein JWP89_6460 [Schlesneria sp.]|nr:hypothetical protein [Schlesneria sp.]
MDDLFQRWRWRGGIVALLATLFFAGAWVKSAVDLLARRHREVDPSPIGNILISGSYDFSPPSQVNWTVSGLYSTATMTFEPKEVDPRLPDSISSADAQIEEEKITPATHSDFADPANNFVMQSSATSEGAKLDGVLPLPQGSFRVDTASPDLLEDSLEVDDDPGKITLDRRLWGLRVVQESYADSSQTGIVIPHWMLALPCALVAATLLYSSRRGGNKGEVVNTAIATPQSHRTASTEGFFHGWRPKLGVLALLITLALAGGWIRSFSVSDLVNLEVGSETELRFISAKDGLVFQQYQNPDNTGSGTRYRTRTGKSHEELSFRPKALEEPADVPELAVYGETNQEPDQGPDYAQYGSTTLPGQQNGSTGLPLQRYGSVSLPGQIIENPVPATVSVPVEMTRSLPYGQSIEWGGLFAHNSPQQLTIVIPYGYLVIPLTLLSSVLLLKRRICSSFAR